MAMSKFKLVVAVAAMATALVADAAIVDSPAQTAQATSLEVQFINPPKSARPRVWWHWLNGNVTKAGIAQDLDWMERVGIGGLQNFDVDLNAPVLVKNRLVYMTPEWKDAFRFAASEAERRGLELAIAASPGWSETGGPWVAPKDGLKKLVWSETLVAGGKRFTGKLSARPGTTGAYQDLPFFDPLAALSGDAGHNAEWNLGFRQILAFLAAPAKHEGVSALEAQHTLSRPRQFNEAEGNFLLDRRRLATALAGVFQHHAGLHPTQNIGVHQRIIDHNVAILHGVIAEQRHEARRARPSRPRSTTPCARSRRPRRSPGTRPA